jgi:hypothetical protein
MHVPKVLLKTFETEERLRDQLAAHRVLTAGHILPAAPRMDHADWIADRPITVHDSLRSIRAYSPIANMRSRTPSSDCENTTREKKA